MKIDSSTPAIPGMRRACTGSGKQTRQLATVLELLQVVGTADELEGVTQSEVLKFSTGGFRATFDTPPGSKMTFGDMGFVKFWVPARRRMQEIRVEIRASFKMGRKVALGAGASAAEKPQLRVEAQATQADDAAGIGDRETLEALADALLRAFDDVRRRVAELEQSGQLPRLSEA